MPIHKLNTAFQQKPSDMLIHKGKWLGCSHSMKSSAGLKSETYGDTWPEGSGLSFAYKCHIAIVHS